MSKSDTLDKLSNILSNYNPAFSAGFADRVMKSIELEDKREEKIVIEFYNIFKLVALSGVAAIIILLFSVYITEGSFSADAFYGLMDYTANEPILTSFNF